MSSQTEEKVDQTKRLRVTPVYIKVPSRKAEAGQRLESQTLFAWLHEPYGQPSSNAGVILCQPFGGHRLHLYIASQLALNGIWAMRIDLYGTGDSAGSDARPELLCLWLDSIHVAVDAFLARGVINKVCLFGFQLGATLSLFAAAQSTGSKIQELILWSPYSLGNELCREIALADKLLGKKPPSVDATSLPLVHIPRELFGFRPSLPLLAALADLDASSIGRTSCRRAFILSNKAQFLESPIAKHLQSLGSEVELDKIVRHPQFFGEYGEVRPLTSVLVNRAVAWLLRSSQQIISNTAGSTSSRVRNQLMKGSTGQMCAEIDESVIETVQIYGETESLFGILSSPNNSLDDHQKPAVILINSGWASHTGVGRMYVEWARSWASLGHQVLRFDLSGLGDSPALEAREEFPPYPPSSLIEITRVMDALGDAGRGEAFVLCGVCSGGTLAFIKAVEDQRVVGIQLVNPPSFCLQWPNPVGQEYLVNLFRRWKGWPGELFKKDIGIKLRRVCYKCTLVTFAFCKSLIQHPLQLYSKKTKFPNQNAAAKPNPAKDAIRARQGFLSLSQRNVQILIAYDADDIGLDYFRLNIEKSAQNPNIQVRVFEGAGHVFQGGSAATDLLAALTDHLDEINMQQSRVIS